MRLRRLEEEYEGRVEFEWRAFLLRPQPREIADRRAAIEKFRAYTRSWLRPAADPDSGSFELWHSDEGPPTHSIPAHRVSKAAQRLGKPAFDRLHARLLRAYFSESRDISRRETLLELWREVDLPPEAFAVSEEPGVLDEVLADHREALACGATGAPAVRLADNRAAIVGAHPIGLYRHWIERSLARETAGRPTRF